MRIIVEADLSVDKIDGFDWVHDAQCQKEFGCCFSFDETGRMVGKCGKFQRLPNGVKLCGVDQE